VRRHRSRTSSFAGNGMRDPLGAVLDGGISFDTIQTFDTLTKEGGRTCCSTARLFC